MKYREFFRRSGSLLLYRGKVFRGQKNENNDTGVLFLHEIINKQCLLAKNNSIRATAHQSVSGSKHHSESIGFFELSHLSISTGFMIQTQAPDQTKVDCYDFCWQSPLAFLPFPPNFGAGLVLKSRCASFGRP